MNFIDKKIMDYVINNSEDEPELLKELSKETYQKILQPRMLSGHPQGRLLSLLSKMIRPKRILEIGTYTGYGTICLAEGLADTGKIITIDINEELIDFQNKYFERSGYRDKIIQLNGEALDVIDGLNEKFDIVFLDADKENYIEYYKLISNKMVNGGILISDNVLWSGKVLESSKLDDIETNTLNQFNQLIKDDKRFETIIIPIRDGISISRLI
ncbi:MAG: O-methyltransferase [Flavobacteriales bacterium]|jgi:predicted O-methyltransferase YrrM|nr:MAG: O-methyltransferase [Flavobacteriales bacterium]|tara:strand:+ start:702 stop:1343 length:642 start_codon:yes stop_codon:yes gene_type:complete